MWLEPRSYSRAEAWIDLIQSAKIEDCTTIIKGGRILCINRGELHASLRYLAQRWGRSVKWVKNYLSFLESERAISLRNTQGETLITLINYDTYNRKRPPPETPSDTPSSTPRVTPSGTKYKNLRIQEWGESARAREAPTPDFLTSDSEMPVEKPPDVPGDSDEREEIDHFGATKMYWNLKGKKMTKVKMSTITELIASPAIANNLASRLEEYGGDIETIFIAIDRIEEAEFWYGKELGITTFLKDTIFPKFLNGEWKNHQTEKQRR
jgi:hypothetical protein